MIRLLALLLCSLAAACTFDIRPGSGTGASDDESAPGRAVMIDAELFYPERIALPGDSRLLVTVDAVDASGRTSLTRFSTALDGRQVPIPLQFSFEPQEGSRVLHELSIGIVAGDELLRLAGPVLVRVSEGRAPIDRIRLHAPLDAGFGQAWECGSARVLLGAVDTGVFLAVDNALHAVEPVAAASGARYHSKRDPALGIHEKGGELLLLRGDDDVSECHRIEALEPPVSGRGNEPGWHIDIEEDSIELASDYGQTVTRARLIGAGTSGATTHFRGSGESGPILASFSRRVCRDSATGMPHPHGVRVQFEDGTLNGCGGEPLDLLVEHDWLVTQLGDASVPDNGSDGETIEITMRFDDEGRVSGGAACNRYAAEFELGGEGLSLGRAAATKMACAEPRMTLEGRFLALLSQVQRFDIGPDGELRLITPAGPITAVPQAP